MAKFTLVIEDTDDGSIGVTGEFDPELVVDGPCTPAQSIGLDMLMKLSGEGTIERVEGNE